MDQEFTPALQFAWNRAGRIATDAGRPEIEPLDLLRGLLAEAEGYAVRRLTDAGFELASWQTSYPGDPGLSGEEFDEVVPPAPALRLVMMRAHQEIANLTDEGSLSTDQVLTALIALAGAVRQALEGCGLDADRFRDEGKGESIVLTLDEPLDLVEEPDRAGAARIVDAAANRAREALRVVEDHCRFALDDALLSRQCKELRHALTEALAELPPGTLITARDTSHDVGVAISTDAERQRGSLQAVLAANLKRLQEALRSLEEFGKVLSPTLGERIEQLRYRSYVLEKAVSLGGVSRDRLANAFLYALVTEASCRASVVGTVRELVEGGVDVIQFREKQLDDRTLLEHARIVRELTRKLGALFIVNDRPDIAVLSEADGVHLGQDDLPVAEARKIVGPRAIVGVSTHDVAQVRQAVFDGATYIGVGPTFTSQTKNFANFAGLDFVKEVASQTSLPAFAIGGITLENLDEVLAAGACRVAASHALCAAEDPRRTASLFRKKLAEAAKNRL